MATVKEIKTFIAGEDLAAHRRVKVMTASPATTSCGSWGTGFAHNRRRLR